MADVFISYSQKDRAIAQRLAELLKARGVDVWWDTEIVGGEHFRDQIMKELQAAKVALVLWSMNSVGSRFVLDEADHAATSGKLISILTEGFQARHMPMGFGSFQAVPIEEEERLLAALKKRGLSTSDAQAQDLQIKDDLAQADAAWEFVSKSDEPKLLAEFVRRYPDSKHTTTVRNNWAKTRVIHIFFFSVTALGSAITFMTNPLPDPWWYRWLFLLLGGFSGYLAYDLFRDRHRDRADL